jgi:hypothetical protein
MMQYFFPWACTVCDGFFLGNFIVTIFSHFLFPPSNPHHHRRSQPTISSSSYDRKKRFFSYYYFPIWKINKKDVEKLRKSLYKEVMKQKHHRNI